MHSPAPQNPSLRKFEQILEPAHSLCKEDVVWVLEFIKKKVAERDPELLDLPQPRLLENFRNFAEAAMLMIHHRPGCGHEADRLREWLGEASYGLHGDKA